MSAQQHVAEDIAFVNINLIYLPLQILLSMRKSKSLERNNYNLENGGEIVLDYDLYSYDGSQAYSKSVSTNDIVPVRSYSCN